MRVRAFFTCTIALLLGLALAQPSPAAEEFVGPFASWANVRRDYGAVGDGKTDDTAAIQKGLDDLRAHRQHCVLFFPAGTYRITRTVRPGATDLRLHRVLVSAGLSGKGVVLRAGARGSVN